MEIPSNNQLQKHQKCSDLVFSHPLSFVGNNLVLLITHSSIQLGNVPEFCTKATRVIQSLLHQKVPQTKQKSISSTD
jgi:hypothetical protein